MSGLSIALPANRVEVAAEKIARVAEPGRLFTHEQIVSLLGVPAPSQAASIREYKRRSMALAGDIEQLKRELLTVHKIALRNVQGQGYVVVSASDHTPWTAQECLRKFRKTYQEAHLRASNVDLAKLSDRERQVNRDYQQNLRTLARETARELRKLSRDVGAPSWDETEKAAGGEGD